MSKAQNLDEPIFGVHDVWIRGDGIRSADDLGIVGASVDQVRIPRTMILSSYGRVSND